MTTNVPQDVLKLAEQAGLLPEPLKLYDEQYLGQLVKFAELLRAQSQQGAEPVAFEQVEDCFGEDWTTEPDGRVLLTAQQLHDFAQRVNSTATPPQANNATEHPCDLLVAAAYRKAAEICDKQAEQDRAAHEAPVGSITRGSPYHEGAADAADECMFKILAAIPADAEAALREVCMNVAIAVRNAEADTWKTAKLYSLDDVVNSVLGEGGK
jgi:hypothetical protein